ncbi:MAG: hypothetical protein JNN04_07930 [Cyclobacteriaceae bacterium]|nr:hypothetical protein [Cyclobacteriaceae bacterium]
MTFQERTRLLLQFDELIRRKYKADAGGYARKLGISRGSFFRLLACMREEFQAPIQFEKSTQCYAYTRKGRIYIGFVPDPEDTSNDHPAANKSTSPVADAVNQYLQHPGNRQEGSTP